MAPARPRKETTSSSEEVEGRKLISVRARKWRGVGREKQGKRKVGRTREFVFARGGSFVSKLSAQEGHVRSLVLTD
jgi:hypothetical protein